MQSERMPAGLIAGASPGDHEGQLLGVDGHHQAAIGSGIQRRLHEAFLIGRHQDQKRRVGSAKLTSQSSAQP